MWLMFLVMIFPLVGIGLFFVLPLATALPIYLVVCGFSFVCHRAMMRSPKWRVRTGRLGMIGQKAEVLSWEGTYGEVRCHAEIWRARTEVDHEFESGDRVKVVACDDLTLTVEPVERSGPRRVEGRPPARRFDDDRYSVRKGA